MIANKLPMGGATGSVLLLCLVMGLQGKTTEDKGAAQEPPPPPPQASALQSGPIPGPGPKEVGQYCETESFNATCAADEVVFITHARYGRMQISRCVKLDYGHLGCASDVTAMADARCSGRRRCEIQIPNNWFAQKKPCPDDLKPYLEVSYRCLKVHSIDTICNTPGPILLTSSQGYLASHITDSTGCGGPKSPWVINAKPGQKINLKLFDFSVAVREERGETPAFPHCPMYAIIREKLPSGVKNFTVCGGLTREKPIYTSSGPSVEVIIVQMDRGALKTSVVDEEYGGGKSHFMLKYEVSGCPDIQHSMAAWSVRNGDGVRVKCNFSSEVFHLKCVGSKWVGDLGNCSKAPLLKHSKIEYEEIHIPYGMSIMIVIVIALVIGLFVLTIGLFFLKKQKGLCQPRPPPEEDIYGQRDLDGDMGEKEYVRAPWQTHTASQGSVASVKNIANATWPRENEYPAFGTELPPCTPLMDRFHKPPLYGQLGSKLPCGCPTYMTRSEVIQSGGGGVEGPGDSPQHRAGQVSVNPSNPDHVQYFIVEPGVERNQGQQQQPQQVITSQNTLPRGQQVIQQGSNSTSTFKPPVQNNTNNRQQQQQQQQQQQPGNSHQQQQQPNNHAQTDEIKLRMRKTDTGPVAPGSNATPKPATVHESYKALCKDRLENASNDRLECVTRDGTKDTEL